METVKLNNGMECPVIGIGTFMLSPTDTENSVRDALMMGYSLVDTANAYVNERAVGRGIRASGIKRENVFLSTKLWTSEYENPNAVDETLERLGVEYVDLLYITSRRETGLPAIVSWRKHTGKEKQNPSASRTSRVNTSRNWKPNGRLCRSLFRSKRTPISHSSKAPD